MTTVHVFTSTGRFSSAKELRQFVDMSYTEDGDGIDSEFMREVGLLHYEPACIEAVVSDSGVAVPVRELLARASWAEQWLFALSPEATADAAICVYPPNTVETPSNCSLSYVGALQFEMNPSYRSA